jgi:two-component system heavy metal sensor histidine kinase CusS
MYDPEGRLSAHAGALPTWATEAFSMHSNNGTVLLSSGLKVNGVTIAGTQDWTGEASSLRRLDFSMVGLWLLLQVIIAGVSWFVARSTFKPLDDLTRQAAQLSGNDLAMRLSSEDVAEFGSFADQLNLLLNRIEVTARREEQFAADAAHELRTPLTVLMASLETSLTKNRSAEEYRHQMSEMVPEVERLARLVELLLRSTRGTPDPAGAMDIKGAAELAVARWRDRFEETGVHLEARLEEARSSITEEELDSVMDNLLENALRHSPAGSTAVVSLQTEDDSVYLRVADQGNGIAPDLVEHIFERLTTGEKSRSKASGGYGIGLALCQSILRSRGGDIRLTNNAGGAEFTVTLKADEQLAKF